MAQTRQVTLQYAGGSSGEGPLTLGQDNMVRCILHDEPMEINKFALWPIPPGASVEAVLDALRVLVERHESLRTLYPGAPGEHPTRQVVHAEGQFEVEIVEAGPGQDPEALAQAAGRRDRAVRFDLSAHFPLRFTLVTVDGAPARLSTVVCHTAADGAATALLIRDWFELAEGRPLPALTAPTPRELAEQERSAAGQRRIKGALRHWERVLMQGPQAVFADDDTGASPGLLPTLIARSVSAAGNLRAVAERTGSSPSAVMLAAYAALLSYRAGQSKVVVAALSSNRHRPGLEDYVGTLAQDALICVDAETADFDALVSGAGGAALAGYWNSTFDSEQVWRLIDESAHRRGARFARHVVLNDLSTTVPDVATRTRPDPPADPDLAWWPTEYVPCRIMLNLWRLRDCVELTLHADPRLFSREATQGFVLGMFALLEAAATRAVALTELGALTGVERPRRAGDRWRRIEDSWIDLDAVRHLLDTALDKRSCEVEVDDGRLVAHIADEGRPLTPHEAHRAVMNVLFTQNKVPSRGESAEGGAAADGAGGEGTGEHEAAWAENRGVSGGLSGWETARAPYLYVIHEGAARVAGDPASWAALPVVAEGDGRGVEG